MTVPWANERRRSREETSRGAPRGSGCEADEHESLRRVSEEQMADGQGSEAMWLAKKRDGGGVSFGVWARRAGSARYRLQRVRYL